MRTMLLVVGWVIQSAPSGPVMMSTATACGTGNSVITPAGVIRPTGFALVASVNQTSPPGPAVMANGEAAGVGVGNSVITPVLGTMRAMRLAVCSVNQTFPSGPGVIC